MGNWTGQLNSVTQTPIDTIGLYDPTTGTFYLRNSNSSGPADITFQFGPANAGYIPFVGDWTGLINPITSAAMDTVGVYDPVGGFFFLKNLNAPGPADSVFSFGVGGQGWVPRVGDWTGKVNPITMARIDTVGAYDPASAFFFLKNTNAAGAADIVFQFGPTGLGWNPVVGDWTGQRSGTTNAPITTIGAIEPSTSFFFLRNSNSNGPADIQFVYGPTGSFGSPPPELAKGSAADNAATAKLSQDDLQLIVANALVRWSNVGLTTAQVNSLSTTKFVISDLSGQTLGLAATGTVFIDDNAAGFGWYVDPTPQSDLDDFSPSSAGLFQAIANGPASNKMDLLTVVLHEMGHELGLSDVGSPLDLGNVMADSLAAGLRRTDLVDALFAHG